MKGPLFLTAALWAAAIWATAGQSHAGNLTCAGTECRDSFADVQYKSTKCQAPAELGIKQITALRIYNEEVKRAQAYADQERDYFHCLTEEANGDLAALRAAISGAVKSTQDVEQAKLDKIQTTFQTALDVINNKPERSKEKNGDDVSKCSLEVTYDLCSTRPFRQGTTSKPPASVQAQ